MNRRVLKPAALIRVWACWLFVSEEVSIFAKVFFL